MKKRNINISLWAGFIFIIIGIATALTKEFLAAVSALALGVSLLLLEPPLTTGKTDEPTDRSDDKGQFWGIKLTSRNIVALMLLAVAVVAFMAVMWGDFAE
jgi:hypothetical protein